MSSKEEQKGCVGFIVEAFHLFDKVTAMLSILLGLVIVYFAIQILLEKPQPLRLASFNGEMKRYQVLTSKKGEIKKVWIEIIGQQKDLDTAVFNLRYPEVFKKKEFEKEGGRIGEPVTIMVDSSELSSKFRNISQLIYKQRKFIDEELVRKEAQGNRWWMLASGITLVIAGILIFFIRRILR